MAIRNRIYQDLYSWINNSVGIEYHDISRNWVREIKVNENENSKLDIGHNVITYKNQDLGYGADYSIVPAISNNSYL